MSSGTERERFPSLVRHGIFLKRWLPQCKMPLQLRCSIRSVSSVRCHGSSGLHRLKWSWGGSYLAGLQPTIEPPKVGQHAAFMWSCYFLDMLMHRRLATLFHVIQSVACTSAPLAKQVALRARRVSIWTFASCPRNQWDHCHRCAFPNLCPQMRSGAVWRNFAMCCGSLQRLFCFLPTFGHAEPKNLVHI